MATLINSCVNSYINTYIDQLHEKYPEIPLENLRKIWKEINIEKPNETPQIFTGTSGYIYDWWFIGEKKDIGYYPNGVSKANALKYYAHDFTFCEINSTFYKLPSKKTVENWYSSTPDNFKFLVKFTRFATHAKKLYNFEYYYNELYNDRISHLREKCLGFLIQLGPNFINGKNRSKIDNLNMFERVEKMCKIDNKKSHLQLYIEFRHTSWFCQEVYSLLKKYNVVLVNVHLNNDAKMFGNMVSGFALEHSVYKSITEDTGMIRCHGTWKQGYAGGYSLEQLTEMYSLAEQYSQFIIVFDNTDTFEGQYEEIMYVNGVKKYAVEIEYVNVQKFPHAIANAKIIQSLSRNQLKNDM